MHVKSAIALPVALALGLLLAACDNNNPPRDPVTPPPTV
jgi:hypothetical protein